MFQCSWGRSGLDESRCPSWNGFQKSKNLFHSVSSPAPDSTRTRWRGWPATTSVTDQS